jgi:hypothetical protein
LESGSIPIGHYDACAFLGEQISGSFSDTVGAGADEGVFSFDLIIHRLLDS